MGRCWFQRSETWFRSTGNRGQNRIHKRCRVRRRNRRSHWQKGEKLRYGYGVGCSNVSASTHAAPETGSPPTDDAPGYIANNSNMSNANWSMGSLLQNPFFRESKRNPMEHEYESEREPRSILQVPLGKKHVFEKIVIDVSNINRTSSLAWSSG